MSPRACRFAPRRIQELLLGFSRGISATLSVGGALEAAVPPRSMTSSAPAGSSVWLHDRRARELALAGSSDRATPRRERASPTESDTIPARGLRLDGPHFVAPTPPAVPHPRRAAARLAPRARHARRRRRADSDSTSSSSSTAPTSSPPALGRDRERAAARGILQQRRLLEDTFNSLVDLVVVIDNGTAGRADERRVRGARRPLGAR